MNRPRAWHIAGLLLTAALVWPCAQALGAPPRSRVQTQGRKGAGARCPWRRRARVGMRVVRHPQLNGGPGLMAAHEPVQQVTLPGLNPRQVRELGLRPHGRGLLDLSSWPAEPAAPATWDPVRFTRAMQNICPVLAPPVDLARYSGWILKYGQAFGVDPSLLAALIYQQSRCNPRRRTDYGLGLAMINRPMHRIYLRDGRYHFMVKEEEKWVQRSQVLNRFPFSRRSLLNPENNIYFAAGILAVFGRQCPEIDQVTGSVPHRHMVSHFVWGDRVRDPGVEDQILRDRRRFLGFYGGVPAEALGLHGELALGCPLDGCPRKVTSILGDDREGGRRRHNGLDILTDQGEAVRTIADGQVVLAGVDLSGKGLRELEPSHTRLVPASRMGPRGLLVKVRHPGGLLSEYMHLSAYTVKAGQKVARGALLGYVGRTGMKESDAHLHMGIVYKGLHIDPMPLLKGHLIHPDGTALGRFLAKVQENRRSKRRKPATPGRAQKLVLPVWAEDELLP